MYIFFKEIVFFISYEFVTWRNKDRNVTIINISLKETLADYYIILNDIYLTLHALFTNARYVLFGKKRSP